MKHPLRLSLIGLLFLLGLGVTARAQVTISCWNGNGAANDPTDAANWNNGIVPTFDFENPGDFVGIINGGQTITLTSDVSGTIFDTLRFGSGTTNGTLNVQSGGNLITFSLVLGADAGSTGTATVCGSGTLNPFQILVGDAGTGSLTISSGGTVSTSAGIAVASQAGSTGTFLLTGSGSSVTGGIYGGAGTAHITITDSAMADSVGSGDGNTDITISNNATINGGTVGLSGAGTSSFVVNTGATLAHSGIQMNATTGGTATGTIDSGNHTLDYGIFVSGTGTNTLTVQNGATLDGTGSSNQSFIGFDNGESGTVTLTTGSSWSSGGDLSLGRSGTGTLNVQTGSSASFQTLTVGENEGGNGTLNVDGTGSTLTTVNNLNIGNAGTGTMNITAGGVVTSPVYGVVGSNSGGTGIVTISGTGSQWYLNNSGAGLEVGSNGTGSITVSNGGALTVDGTSTLGTGSGGSGSVTVTGSGSTWTSGFTVTIGTNSDTRGSITLANGGNLTITDGHLLLGNASGSTGTLNIGAAANQAAAAPGTLTFTSDPGGNLPGSGAIRTLFGTGTVVFNHTSSSYHFDHTMDFSVGVLQQAGTTFLDRSNTYDGGTTISGGTLALGANNALGAGNLVMSGGTLHLANFSQDSVTVAAGLTSVSAGTLNVTASSYIDFGAADSALILGDSSGVTWSGALAITNFTNGSDVFRVGLDANGLSGTQLGLITIDGNTALIDASGYLTSSGISAVPEPATYALLAGVGALGLAALRRRARRMGVTARL